MLWRILCFRIPDYMAQSFLLWNRIVIPIEIKYKLFMKSIDKYPISDYNAMYPKSDTDLWKGDHIWMH